MACFSNDPPPPPNYAAANREGVLADAETLAFRRQVEAAARLGTKVTLENPRDGEPVTYDFTNHGDADIDSGVARQMTKTVLELQQEHGVDFVQQRLRELQVADPEGFEARKTLYDSIVKGLDASPDRPIAEELESQILDDLKAGGALDEQTRREVTQSSRAGQAARGNVLGTASAFQEAMQVGRVAEERRDRRKQQALSYLTSGATPEDVQYRRHQQNLSNLSSFVNNVTPVAQFGQLSGAQSGASPFAQASRYTNIDPNAGQNAVNFRTNVWNQQMNYALNTMNDLAFITSTAADVAGAAAGSF